MSRPAAVLCVAAVISLSSGYVLGAPDQPIFIPAYDKKVIAQRIRQSLASTEHGSALPLQATDPAELSTAGGPSLR